MYTCRKLIESAIPVKEISAESVRDKSIRHGHISTLHLWWARRPLPVCRAVIFASLVPDPEDPACPESFRQAVKELLSAEGGRKYIPNTIAAYPDEYSSDPWKPYDDIPYTSAIDSMEDNLRNRLMMFIGKFSLKFAADQKSAKKTAAKYQLSPFSLIKWDNKNNEEILNMARKFLWVAFDPVNNELNDYDTVYGRIKELESKLYSIPDRHKAEAGVKELEDELEQAIDDFQKRMPAVFDPFAGGGAIPLEAARLGCRSFGNDLNPVAHIIQKGSLEFPQRFGKPLVIGRENFLEKYGDEELLRLTGNGRGEYNGSSIRINNRLSWDVEHYARRVLSETENEIGDFYPADENGKKPIAYYWARVGTCSNPSCRAKVPLLKQFYLVNKPGKQVYLKSQIEGKEISFTVVHGKCEEEGWNNRGNLKCPFCGNVTSVKVIKEQMKTGKSSEKILAVIESGETGKEYRLPFSNEEQVLSELPDEIEAARPTENMQRNSAGGDTFSWGVTKWGQMFSPRQLLLMQTLVDKLTALQQDILSNEPGEACGTEGEYNKAILTYLGIWIDRIAIVNTSFGRWNVGGEKIEHPFSRQAIPMIFDFPESNPFCHASGSAFNMLDWVIRYINSESDSPFYTTCNNASSGNREQFPLNSLDAVVTDPPYYDAIAYADLSDFFYVWLKRTLTGIYPMNFAFPQTPKTEECTALKHHHKNSLDEAKRHFEKKLQEIFTAVEHQTRGVVSVMFAHQSTEAWTTLCNSVLGANMNISGSWAISTERDVRMVAIDQAALASSVTVACRPSTKEAFGEYREVREAILGSVREQVRILYSLGFRGADLLTACFGHAVQEFGKYKLVEKADGSAVTVGELLDYTREAAFNAIISDIDTDDITRFYIGWLNLFGFSEATHDDVRRISQIGLNIDAKDLLDRAILLREGNKEFIGQFKVRMDAVRKLGERKNDPMVDKAHRAFFLYASGNRTALLKYLKGVNAVMESTFWRVVNALAEVLPADCDDCRQAAGLLSDRESLVREMESMVSVEQVEMEF